MSNFSNLSRQIVPYNITGLQDINVNTINGTTPFNGVSSSGSYPLSYDSTTGILSQSPIGQSVETTATPSFNRVNLTGTPAITTTSTTLHIRPASFTTRFNNDGIHGFVEIECAGTTTTGQVLFYLANGTLQALMRADTSYFYFYNLNATAGCVYYTKGGVVFYCSYGQSTGTGEIVFKDNNVEVFTANAVNGITMKNSNKIQSVAGTNLILNAPTGQQINFNINNTTKFYVNNTSIYAISLPSATQTNILGYDTTTGQITYQPLPTIPLSITVNNIASDTTHDLSLSSANNNVNITALSTIGGTGAGNININFQRYLSFLNNSVEVARIDQATGRLIFPNLGSTTNTPIQFSGTGINYINTGSGTVGLRAGNNNFTVSPTDIQANISAINILKINSTGLIVNNIFAQPSTNLTLNADAGIDFNIAGTTYASMTSTGLLVNNVNSIGGMDLVLSSITGLITTSSSLTMYGGNLNLLDYSTGLIQSQLFTDTTGLIISTPSTKDIRFKIASSVISSITSTGLSSSLSTFNIQNSNSLNDIALNAGGGVSVCNFAGTYITRFNVAGNQIYLPYFSSGYYGINMQTSTVGNYYLHYINGTTYQIINASSVGVQLTYGSTSWASASDIRLKKNIQPLRNSLELINQLNPITYNWKDENLSNNNIGFIAQEVQEVIPEITEDYDIKGEKYLGIRTTDLIPYLVKSIQELSKDLNGIKEILKRNNIKY